MKINRSGISLAIVGVLCGGFFLGTDPHFAWARVANQNLVDAASQNRPGTWIGVIGSSSIFFIGVWLLSRKTV